MFNFRGLGLLVWLCFVVVGVFTCLFVFLACAYCGLGDLLWGLVGWFGGADCIGIGRLWEFGLWETGVVF